jgi:replicative DNA helicase
MNEELRIDSKPMESLGELWLHVIIYQGDRKVFSQAIPADDMNAVIALTDQAVAATGANSTNMEQALTDHIVKARAWWQQERNRTSGFQPNFLTSAGLEALDVRPRWLVKNIVVRDQPLLLGGPKKSMKTSIMLDLAISLGSGRQFLGKFDVPDKVKVLVLSGESGKSTIKETALRIARTKGVALSACDVLWGFELPRLGVDADLVALGAGMRDNQIAVVIIDPAYLCLLAGVQEVNASNMFQVGPLLLRVSRVCQESGTTLVLVHHTTKMAGMQKTLVGEPPELEDLAYAGFQEFARQWLLVNRREKYETGSGKHQLWLNLGGSAGHSGCWGLDIDEGKLNEDFGGRQWVVQVRTVEEAKRAVAEVKEQKKEVRKKARLDEVKAKLRQVMPSLPQGETCTALADMIGESTRVVTPALSDMLAAGEVVLGQIVKQAGRRKQTLPAWRLASPVDTLRSMTTRMGLKIPGGEQEDAQDNIAEAQAALAG